MRARKKPLFLLPGAPLAFPDPNLADDEGMLAIGGDLSPERLLFAYEHGIFPWYDEGLPPMWWSPNPRTVLDPERLHVSRTVAGRPRPPTARTVTASGNHDIPHEMPLRPAPSRT